LNSVVRGVANAEQRHTHNAKKTARIPCSLQLFLTAFHDIALLPNFDAKSHYRKLAERELRRSGDCVCEAHWNPSIVLDAHAGWEHDRLLEAKLSLRSLEDKLRIERQPGRTY
jgi:hypothetical protein